MTNPPLTFSIDANTQTIEELWKSVADLSTRRVADNALCRHYPLSVRVGQLNTIKCLIQTIEKTHNLMNQVN